MYILDTYSFKDKDGNILSREYEYKYYGNYGAKGEKRLPRKQITPEQIARQNHTNKVKKIRRKLKNNFYAGDYWITLTYSKDTAKTIEEVMEDLKNMLDKLRRKYKKAAVPMKWIRRIEIGSRGGIHVHMVLNRIEGLDIALTDLWKHGHVNIEVLDGNYDNLAEYIAKEPTDQQKKLMRSMDIEESKIIRYSCSRNLVEPLPEREEKSHKTMKSIFNNDLEPHKGFYIDKDSIIKGINYVTGMAYLQYEEKRCTTEYRSEPVHICECPHCHQMTLMSVTCDCKIRRKRWKR